MPELSNEANPTTRQIFELATTCLELGRAEGSRLARGSSRSWLFKTDFLSAPDQGYYDFIFGEQAQSVSRYFMGRIALVRNVAWNMQIKDTSYMFEGADLKDTCQITHCFRWAGDSVFRAERLVHFVEADDEQSYQIPGIDFSLLHPESIIASRELKAVSSGDCDRLKCDLEAVQAGIAQNKASAA